MDIKHALEIIGAAVGILIFVIVLSINLSTVNTGKDAYNTGNDALTSSLSKLSSTEYDMYEGTTQLGTSVIRLINSTIRDEDIEILVCTKDGSNYVYNTKGVEPFGTTKSSTVYKTITDESSSSFLTNMVATDACGNAFDSVATVSLAPRGTTDTDLLNSAGYNTRASLTTSGYISTSASFSCSVQRDINGTVRRITCVQE